MKQKRLVVPRIDGDHIQLYFAIHIGIVEDHRAAGKPQVVLYLLLDSGQLYVYVGCLFHSSANPYEIALIFVAIVCAVDKIKQNMNKIEHIGIAVRDLAEARQTFSRFLGQEPYKEETVESEGVTTLFYQVGEVKIELLAATRSDSAIARFIEKRGEGIHHIAFGTSDVEGESERLRQQGFVILNDRAKAGADNMLINFLHPKGLHGVLAELCQEKN